MLAVSADQRSIKRKHSAPYFDEAGSSGASMIVLQHAAESLSTFDLASDRARLVGWIDESIAQTLVIAFLMKMLDVLVDGPFQRLATKEDHSVETLGLQTSEPAFHVSVQIWTSRRKQDNLYFRVVADEFS